jgi:hypothetical protein
VVISVSALIYLVFGITISIITAKNKDKLVDLCLKKIGEQAHEGNYWSPIDHWSKPFDKRQEDNVQPEQRELCLQAVKFYIGFAVVYTVAGFLLMVILYFIYIYIYFKCKKNKKHLRVFFYAVLFRNSNW